MNCSELTSLILKTRCAARSSLPSQPVGNIVGCIAQAAQHAQRQFHDDTVARQAAQATGFSVPMIREMADRTFGILTADALHAMLKREFGAVGVLDGFSADGGHLARAIGPELIAHFLAGNIPPPGIVSLCCGLMLKAGNVARLSSRDSFFATRFVEAIRLVMPSVADAIALVDWPRSARDLNAALIGQADAIIAYGSDETVDGLRAMTARDKTFLGYGHKFSIGIVERQAMTDAVGLARLAAQAAEDVAVYDQHGCLSPHIIFVESHSDSLPVEFASALAMACETCEVRWPRGRLSDDAAARVAGLYSEYRFRSASDPRVRVWPSGLSTLPSWMVIMDASAEIRLSCLNRVVFVKPYRSSGELAQMLNPFQGKISTVGLAPMMGVHDPCVSALVKLGVHRFCRIGQMQHPALSWYHDGRPNLADLVRWTEWEMGG